MKSTKSFNDSVEDLLQEIIPLAGNPEAMLCEFSLNLCFFGCSLNLLLINSDVSIFIRPLSTTLSTKLITLTSVSLLGSVSTFS